MASEEPPAKKATLAFSDPEGTDLILVADEREFHVSRAVLIFASPVFEAMLTHEFKEKDEKKIDLPGKKPESVEAFLLFISPRHYQVLTDNILPLVLPLAVEYQITHLMEECEERLLQLIPWMFDINEPFCPKEMSNFINAVSTEASKIDMMEWLRIKYQSCLPWWCAMLCLHHVAALLHLSQLENTAWQNLTNTGNFSVWCSSFGFRCPVEPYKSSFGYMQKRFALVGLDTNPFFIKLSKEEQIDIFFAYIKFQTTCYE